MAIKPRTGRRKSAADYQIARVFLWCLVFVGPALIYSGVHRNHRDRPSANWPVTTGTVVQSEWQYHGGKHSYYEANFTYSYVVRGQRYLGHKIRLWNPRFQGDGNTVKGFVAGHHVGAQMDVHYDPQQPANAVLFPGADEFGNRLGIWCGSIIFALSTWLAFRSRRVLAKLIAKKKAEQAEAATRPEPEKISGLPHAFATYEPGCKRKLNCFTDRAELDEVLGHDEPGIQDWNPDDRVIDSAGAVYRLVKNAGKKRYGIEATGERWTSEKLLEVAVADARLLKQDEDALRRRVGNATANRRMAVLMKCIDELPAGPRWAVLGLIAFLILFALGVFLMAYEVASRMQK
jgi:hypothetical protein